MLDDRMNVPRSPTEVRRREAGEELYRQFAAPTPSVIEGCPCCIEKRDVDVLLSTPLRALSGQALWPYVSSVFLTAGSTHDFRYFLPRIFEIALVDPENSNDAEIVLDRLERAAWQQWPQGERDAITAFVDVWLDQAISEDVSALIEDSFGWEAEGVLCGIARAGLPIGPWLARLREPVAAPILADLKARYPHELSAFWDDAPAGLAELSAFLAA
ncbi:hypothetical protein U1839_01710 [Sphingomonas sp. RT2P30]|uniref:hypothetical protein n=1 Tax=Parasphingomonas halimpatiens TaxID=3096162 RepID=UPI002FCA0DBA